MANTFVALSTTTVGAGGAASVTFSSIPSTYTDLVVKISGRTNWSNASLRSDGILIYPNGDTSNMSAIRLLADGSVTSGDNNSGPITVTNADSTASAFGSAEIYIPNYLSFLNKGIITDGVSESNVSTVWMSQAINQWAVSNPITSLQIAGQNGSFVQYTTLTLYGVYNVDTNVAPSAPTIGTAVADNAAASVAFTTVTGASIYTVTSTPGSITATGVVSPIYVTGLTNGVSYTFKVKGSNPYGTSAESAASNSVTPAANSTYDVLVGTTSTPYIQAYPFSSGFGTKYANPSTLPTQTAAAVSFAPNKSALVIAEDGSSPYVSAYAWSSGFGSKYSNPASVPSGRQLGADFKAGSNAVAFGGDSPSPWVHAYPWSSGFGSKYSNPASLPTGGFAVRWNDAGTYISSANNSASPLLAAWAWSSGWGTKVANPASLPTDVTYGQTWEPNGNAIIYSQNATPSLVAYAWSAGYGAKYADPVSTPSGSVSGRVGDFTSSGNAFVAGSNSSPFFNVYRWSSGFGTRYATPLFLPPAVGENAFFTPDNKAIIVSSQGTPAITAYLFDYNAGIYSRYAAPATLPAGTGYGLDVK